MPSQHVELLLAHYSQPEPLPTRERLPMARMHKPAASAVAYPAFLDKLCDD